MTLGLVIENRVAIGTPGVADDDAAGVHIKPEYALANPLPRAARLQSRICGAVIGSTRINDANDHLRRAFDQRGRGGVNHRRGRHQHQMPSGGAPGRILDGDNVPKLNLVHVVDLRKPVLRDDGVVILRRRRAGGRHP